MNGLLLDSNCDLKKCGLQLGVSQEFICKARKRRLSLKGSRKDFLKHCFSSPNSQKIFQKCDDRTKETYADVINGERKSLVTCPPQFEYNSKIKEQSTVADGVLEKIVQEKLYKSENELKDINKFRAIYLPQAGERDIFSPLLSTFFHFRGLFIHGFEPSKYLNIFVTQAEYIRNDETSKAARLQALSWMQRISKFFPDQENRTDKNRMKGSSVHDALDQVFESGEGTIDTIKLAKRRFKKNSEYTIEETETLLHSCLRSTTLYQASRKSFAFNELEKDILKCLGASERDIEQRADEVVKLIKKESKGMRSLGADIHKAIMGCKLVYSNNMKNVLSKFGKNETYDIEDMKEKLMLSMYEDIVKPPGEWDFLLFLSNFKLIFNIEVKRQIDAGARKVANLNLSLRSASHQTMEHAEYASNIFSPFLSEGWQFIKVAAILPGKLDFNHICKHCVQFLVTGESAEEIQNSIINIRTLVLENLRVDHEEGHQDFLNIFSATLGLSSLATATHFGNSWRQIQGPKADYISLAAGWTESELEMNVDELTFKKILNEPHNLNKLLYFNPDQLKLIANEIRLLIFRNDFGSGKTLVLKETSIRMAKRIEEAFRTVRQENKTTLKESKEGNDNLTGDNEDVIDGGEGEEIDISVSNVQEESSDKEEEPLFLEDLFDATDERDVASEARNSKHSSKEEIDIDPNQEASKGHEVPNVNFLCLVATDANDKKSIGAAKGIPRKCRYFFDVRSEMELEKYNVRFLSAQDLEEFYIEKQLSLGVELEGTTPNIYQLAVFFIAHHPNDYHFLDEVPLLKDGFGYNKQSVEKAKLFLQVCVSVLGDASYLWIAFQSNVLCDLTYTNNEFRQAFKDMTEEMSREYGFYLPTLSVNMRNSGEIVELSKAVKPENSKMYNVTKDVIEILSSKTSSVLSRKPRLIPIETQKLKTHLNSVIKTAMDGKRANVFLYNDRNGVRFDPDEIKSSLLELGVKEEDILCHSLDSTTSKDEMKAFLLNPNGVLICQDECFIGMESFSVVYFVADFDSDSNLRCHLMRASSELDIVYAFNKTMHKHIDFGTAIVLSQFIECDDVLEVGKSKQVLVWKCLEPCKVDVNFCKSCAILCHSGHQLKYCWVPTKKGEEMKCNCDKNSSKCLFK